MNPPVGDHLSITHGLHRAAVSTHLLLFPANLSIVTLSDTFQDCVLKLTLHQPWRRNRPPINEEQDWMMRVLVYFCGALSLGMAVYMLKSIWRATGPASLRRRMLSLRRNQTKI